MLTVEPFRGDDQGGEEHPQTSRLHTACTRRKLEAKTVEVDESREESRNLDVRLLNEDCNECDEGVDFRVGLVGRYVGVEVGSNWCHWGRRRMGSCRCDRNDFDRSLGDVICDSASVNYSFAKERMNVQSMTH